MLLANSELDLIACDDLDTAAGVAVKISEIRNLAAEANLDVKLRTSTDFDEWLKDHSMLTGL